MSVVLNSVSTRTITTFQAPVVSEMPGEPEKEKAKPGKSVSIAETTKILIDATVRKKLRSYGESQIKRWIGKRIDSGVHSISVRDARMINEKAGVQVIDLNAENIRINSFTIDSIIRARLELMKNLENPCRELGFSRSELHDIKIGRYISLGKERADAYNEFFKENLFDSERVFQKALTERIFDKEKKLSKRTWIAIGVEHRKELKLLPNRDQIDRWVGGKFSAGICKTSILISVKDAALIHKISGKIIFTFNKEAAAKIPILPAHSDELENFIRKLNAQGKKLDGPIRQKINRIKSQERQEITLALAEEINTLVGKKVFDFKSILDQAVQEAEAEVEEMLLSSPANKRLRTEESAEPELKKRRIDIYRAQEGFVNLDSARQSTIKAYGPNDEAIVKTMAEEEDRLSKAAASPNSQNLTERDIVPDAPQFALPASSASSYHFQYPLTAPQGLEQIASRPSLDLGFILNNESGSEPKISILKNNREVL